MLMEQVCSSLLPGTRFWKNFWGIIDLNNPAPQEQSWVSKPSICLLNIQTRFRCTTKYEVLIHKGRHAFAFALWCVSEDFGEYLRPMHRIQKWLQGQMSVIICYIKMTNLCRVKSNRLDGDGEICLFVTFRLRWPIETTQSSALDKPPPPQSAKDFYWRAAMTGINVTSLGRMDKAHRFAYGVSYC